MNTLRLALASKAKAGEIAAAIGHARRYLQVDEMAEEVHRQLIALYVAD